MIKTSRRSQPRASISWRDMGRKGLRSTGATRFDVDFWGRDLFIRKREYRVRAGIRQTKRIHAAASVEFFRPQSLQLTKQWLGEDFCKLLFLSKRLPLKVVHQQGVEP